MAKGSMGRRIGSKVDTIRAGFGNWGESSLQGCNYGMNRRVTAVVAEQSAVPWGGDAE
jgi:hypothetical protein